MFFITSVSITFCWRYTKRGWEWSNLLHGDRSVIPARIDVNACLIFALKDSNSLKGMSRDMQLAVLILPFRIWSRSSHLLDSYHNVLFDPSKLKPEVCLCHIHSISFLKFFEQNWVISWLFAPRAVVVLSSTKQLSCICGE